ncbi:cytochrome o ubiquinol oxidase subunit IV [Brucella pseudogrignonensis]|jgi:cytochrome o ubiquinol oxidase operon protein cyoD|uniref:cytochrome o ubiquinol oxidase subunit IV n=1 Tax=Brucella pseudogrignonensis TaxID=419475 RepID=UPI000CFD1C1B|nr:cytochrome o ubiquinol oxidase subunit IV [Brucella pseudogrignonensis]MBO1026684.1 cytochrome o ubiquinol oxidase subunit IV [Ochrobactrum sp. SD129]MQP40298.1 cytochrome o ubiquinol oxidase subunit IV [Ochrobactrum sp. MYb237]PQZ39376.1 cytochrome o ubiquinol oxidase subunit IV [Brucella pseudogrignonensis]PRA41121.1 cytochrome o ubiquinol oxidase subunit IV [Brucella pseudogrignonensis]PRA69947.1 cytochrome o ubiquinol oxidase subunit IV [Brucella pseudogrignonensis]
MSIDGNQHGLEKGSHDLHASATGEIHASFSGYMTGFVLSIILTAIPFWLVMGDVLASKQLTAMLVMAIGAVQIVVHMVYFLHMSPRSEGGWTLMALIFTLIIVGIALAGSLWVMHHLNANMMPVSHDMMKNMP